MAKFWPSSTEIFMHRQGKQALNICLLTSQHDKAVKIYKENSHKCTEQIQFIFFFTSVLFMYQIPGKKPQQQ